MTLQRSQDACWGTLFDDGAEQLVLWSPRERRLHVLNQTAATVWDLIQHPIAHRDLVGQLQRIYSANEAVVAGDLDPLLKRLTSSGLIGDHLHTTASPSLDLREPPTDIAPRLGPYSIGPLVALGEPMVVDAEDRQLHDALSAILDPLKDASADLEARTPIRISAQANTDSGWSIMRNGVVTSRPASREGALRMLLAEVNAAPLDRQDETVVLHAAGAEFPSTESLVVFPGVSNAGKSTLVAQLCGRGHGYLTDEAVAIDLDSLEARPFHKSICIEPLAQQLLTQLIPAAGPKISSKWDVDPRSVGPGRLSKGGLISAIVFPTYNVNAATRLAPQSPLAALQRLIANAFDFGSVGQPAFAALVRLANTVPCFSLEHGGDGSQLIALEELFGRSEHVAMVA